MSDLFASSSKTATDYDASAIEVLEGLEPVRRRPGMYIGGTDERALHHLAAEVIDNSMDEAVAGHATRIEVVLEAVEGTAGRLTVTDNGRGIPVDEHPKYPGKSALEVILTTGRRFSDQRGQSESAYQLITIGLTRPRAELYERVDQRIDAMFANGFLDEVKSLLAKGYSTSLPTLSAIGYRECIKVVNGELNEEQAKVEIRRATRVFVRRQANWFKESDPNIKWFNVEDGVVADIEEHIRQSL